MRELQKEKGGREIEEKIGEKSKKEEGRGEVLKICVRVP